MRIKKRYIIIFVVSFVFILATFISFLSWKSRKTFRQDITESLERAQKELNLHESQVIVLENKFEADTCVICGGYLDENYIYSHAQGVGISKKIAGRVAKKVPPYDGYYLLLIKRGKVIFVSDLGQYTTTEVYNQDSKKPQALAC